jgi:crotonobetainyl-CoA:carnitine CoA-transferase CaiB-like acyl-CoA transferase
VTLDLRTAEGAQACRDLVASCEVVVEGMRPGALERRGLGYEALLEVNPSLVFASVSGWGQDGPYRDLGAHGLGFDAFAGLAPPRVVDGRPARPVGHIWQGLESAPVYAALAVVAGVLRARADGRPCRIDVAEADAAVVANLWQITLGTPDPAGAAAPDPAEAAELRAALASSAEGLDVGGGVDLPAADVRYQYYAARDGHVLLMATETKFWRRFCEAVGRPDLFERWPGREPTDHDHGNDDLRRELAAIFATRTQAAWIELFLAHDIAGGPVHDSAQVARDPHLAHRDLWWQGPGHLRLPGSPVRVDGAYANAARQAPAAGQHTDEVLAELGGGAP